MDRLDGHEPVVENPPPPTTGTWTSSLVKNLRVAAEHVGEWVRVATYPHNPSARSTAYMLRKGERATDRAPGIWEFRHGKTPDGQWGVWALYYGPLDPE